MVDSLVFQIVDLIVRRIQLNAFCDTSVTIRFDFNMRMNIRCGTTLKKHEILSWRMTVMGYIIRKPAKKCV